MLYLVYTYIQAVVQLGIGPTSKKQPRHAKNLRLSFVGTIRKTYPAGDINPVMLFSTSKYIIKVQT